MEIEDSPKTQANAARTLESMPLLRSKEFQYKEKKSQERSLATAALAFSLLVHSFLLVSVFPYSGFLAIHLVPGLTEETAGSYAGLISASFMAGRTLSSFEWGKAADKYGRVKVIKASMLSSAIVSILFGLAPTFSLALALRFLLGMCNGFIGPVKTLVTEYADGDNALETKIMGVVMGMRGYGFLINPAISGYLSDPIKQYPDAKIVETFRPMLKAFPFIVPNLVGCAYCLIGYLLAHAFMEETLPEERRQQFQWSGGFFSVREKSNELLRNVSSWGVFKHLHDYEKDVSHHIIGVLRGEKNEEDKRNVTIFSLWKRKAIRQHLLVYWIFSFLAITTDEIFPLFCMSKSSGLGVPEKMIGNILTATGFVYIAMQYFLLTGLVEKYGVYPALNMGTLFSIPIAILVPFSLITNEHASEGTINYTSLAFLSTIDATIRAFAAVVFSSITITTNRTVPSQQRGTLNGLAMLGGSFAKAFGPLFGGILFSTCVSQVTAPFGSVVVYGVITILGFCMCAFAFFLEKYYDSEESPPTRTIDDEQGSFSHDLEKDDSPPSF